MSNSTEQNITTSNHSAATLQLQDVSLYLHQRRLLHLDIEVGAGEIVTIMGPSGSGKSSLLAFIAGFLPSAFRAAGIIRLGQRELNPLPPEQRGIGLLFQDPLLFPHMSVGQNLEFALPRSVTGRKTRISQALEAVELAGMEQRDPETLSGGQKARVALQRLLLAQPSAVLLDEPFSRLDADLRHSIRQQVFSSLRSAGLPAILVTHDIDDARATGGRIIHL